jgi:hypothetical protein
MSVFPHCENAVAYPIATGWLVHAFCGRCDAYLGTYLHPRLSHRCKDRPGRAPRFFTHEGKTQTIRQWSDETGLPRKVIRQRLRRGWSVERALAQPRRIYDSSPEARL